MENEVCAGESNIALGGGGGGIIRHVPPKAVAGQFFGKVLCVQKWTFLCIIIYGD